MLLQVLEFSVKQGWEPLCEFLGVPVPDVPFPRVNSTAEIQSKFKMCVRPGVGILALHYRSVKPQRTWEIVGLERAASVRNQEAIDPINIRV